MAVPARTGEEGGARLPDTGPRSPVTQGSRDASVMVTIHGTGMPVCDALLVLPYLYATMH